MSLRAGLLLGAFGLATACGPTPAEERAAWREGRCEGISDARLHDDCLLWKGSCEGIGAERPRGECWFRVAEASDDVSLCPKAGVFRDQCALHLISGAFMESFPKAAPGVDEEAVAALVASAGFADDDMRPWSAWYRHALGKPPLDRGRCDAVADPGRREACRQTGLALYNDRLNQARDRHLYPCDGGPLPTLLSHVEDPGITSLIAARSDLCP